MNNDLICEYVNQAIDSALIELEQDEFYCKHREIIRNSMKKGDFNSLLTAQMTLQNM